MRAPHLEARLEHLQKLERECEELRAELLLTQAIVRFSDEQWKPIEAALMKYQQLAMVTCTAKQLSDRDRAECAAEARAFGFMANLRKRTRQQALGLTRQLEQKEEAAAEARGSCGLDEEERRGP